MGKRGDQSSMEGDALPAGGVVFLDKQQHRQHAVNLGFTPVQARQCLSSPIAFGCERLLVCNCSSFLGDVMCSFLLFVSFLVAVCVSAGAIISPFVPSSMWS